MDSQDEEKFEYVRRFLATLNVDLIMAYCPKDPPNQHQLKWCRSASALDSRNREDYNAAAAHYYSVAKTCFDHRKNLIRMEYVAVDRAIRHFGIIFRKAKPRPGPANANGQRWHTLVIGAGPIRDAGYVLVARIAVKKPRELKACIGQINKIFNAPL
jgi:hypothetical protein